MIDPFDEDPAHPSRGWLHSFKLCAVFWLIIVLVFGAAFCRRPAELDRRPGLHEIKRMDMAKCAVRDCHPEVWPKR
jgi:hypothetical protein